MNFIMVPLVTGIVTLGIYKFFELLICRRERREIIGKRLYADPDNRNPVL